MPGILASVRRAVITTLLPLGSLLAAGPAFAEDAYILALTWQPGFCADRAGATECRIAPKDEARLTLHGLWPQWDVNGDGRRDDGDDFCLPGESKRAATIALDGGNWLKLPAVKLSKASRRDLERAMPGSLIGLDRHEWWKHGTCSGLAAEDYFAAAILLLRAVERGSLARLLADQAGDTLDRKDLLDAFEADFGRGSAKAVMLDCRRDQGASTLMEIRIRLKRSGITQDLTADSLAVPTKPMRGDCAADVRVPAWPR